jgi:hypothetical protein
MVRSEQTSGRVFGDTWQNTDQRKIEVLLDLVRALERQRDQARERVACLEREKRERGSV